MDGKHPRKYLRRHLDLFNDLSISEVPVYLVVQAALFRSKVVVLSAVLGCHCGDGDVQHWSGVSLIRWFVFGNRKRHPAPTEHAIVRVAFFEAKSMLPLTANPVLVRDPDISVCRNCAASSGNLRKLHLSKFVPVPPRRKLVQTERTLAEIDRVVAQ